MPLEDELVAVAEVAHRFADPEDELTGVVAAEPVPGSRVYLCAFEREDARTWLALDREGRPLADRAALREAVSIVGLCELAEEAADGGRIDRLRRTLAELRAAEDPDGIEGAEAAVEELASTILPAPRLASPSYLNSLGHAATELERVLGASGRSAFAEALRGGSLAVEELARDVETNYKQPLA